MGAESQGQAVGQLMRIGELAGHADVNPKTIRYYESIGLLPPPTRAANHYRLYDDEDLRRLAFVRTAQRLGLSLGDISEILAFRERGDRPCGYVLQTVKRQTHDLDRRISELKALRDELRRLVARAEDLGAQESDFCALIEAHQARQ